MAKGKLRRLAVIGAAIGGVVFFWRKRKGQAETGYGTPDYGSAGGSAGGTGGGTSGSAGASSD